MGADVTQKLFRGFATTAAVNEGLFEILDILLKVGASQPACEEALLEASCHGQCGVDVNSTHRVLLLSSKPSLHVNIDCTGLVAAVVSRQVSTAHMLLQAGAGVDCEVRLGAWSWDTATGEEIRVGAGLGEPYALTWCVVEYFKSLGAILQMLLRKLPRNKLHFGRTLLHLAILCANPGALDIPLNSEVYIESPVKTTSKTEFRPIHIAARLGLPYPPLPDSGRM